MMSLPNLSILIAGGILFAIAGCGGPKPIDTAARFDREVDEVWKQKWQWIDALPFFERGGMYVDSDDTEDDEKLDRRYVVPLLKLLGDEFQLHWHATVQKDKRDFALAVITEMPPDPKIRERIAARIEQCQKTFPRTILVQQGHRWLSLDFLTREQAAFLEGSDEPSAP